MNVTFITHARNQPKILDEHFRVWNSLPKNFLKRWEFFLVDDHSDKRINALRPYLSLYRSHDPMEWNYGLKNLGMKYAKNDWLLLTNVDHVLTLKAIEKIDGLRGQRGMIYRLKRSNPDPNASVRYSDRSHIGTFLIHRQDLLSVGGYDEDFSGHYGHDDTWLTHCLKKKGYREVRLNIRMINYSGSSIFSDADFLTKPQWNRDLTRNSALLQRKMQGKPRANPPILRFQWSQVSEAECFRSPR